MLPNASNPLHIWTDTDLKSLRTAYWEYLDLRMK